MKGMNYLFFPWTRKEIWTISLDLDFCKARINIRSWWLVLSMDWSLGSWTRAKLLLCLVSHFRHSWLLEVFKYLCTLVLSLQNCNSFIFCFSIVVSLICLVVGLYGKGFFLLHSIKYSKCTKEVLHCSSEFTCYRGEKLQLCEALIQRFK